MRTYVRRMERIASPMESSQLSGTARVTRPAGPAGRHSGKLASADGLICAARPLRLSARLSLQRHRAWRAPTAVVSASGRGVPEMREVLWDGEQVRLWANAARKTQPNSATAMSGAGPRAGDRIRLAWQNRQRWVCIQQTCQECGSTTCCGADEDGCRSGLVDDMYS